MDDLISRQAALKVATMDSEIYLAIANLPSAQPLTEADYMELCDRYGEEVEMTVRDMVSGEEKRWMT